MNSLPRHVRQQQGRGSSGLLVLVLCAAALVAGLLVLALRGRPAPRPADVAAPAPAEPRSAVQSPATQTSTAQTTAAAQPDASPSSIAPDAPATAPVLTGTAMPPSCAGALPPAPAEDAPRGVHVVLDGSKSMCGYLRVDDETRRFRELVGELMLWMDTDRNHRVLLLRQAPAKGKGARSTALLDTPPNLKAVVGDAFAKGSCGPFDAGSSDIEIAFDPAATTTPPRSLLLISDMVLNEGAQRGFADRFRDWYRRQPHGAAVSAGIVTVALPFAGDYYAATLRQSSPGLAVLASLPRHDRPLSLAWFAADADDARTIRELLAKLHVFDTPRPEWLLYGLQVAPVFSEDPADWLPQQRRGTAATALFAAYDQKVIAPRSRRDADSLASCVAAPVCSETGELTVRVDRRCRDNRELLDATVDAVQLQLHLDPRSGFVIEPEAAAPQSPVDRSRSLQLALTRATPVRTTLPLRLAVAPANLDAERLNALNLRDEDCLGRAQGNARRIAACTEQMQRRTYGYAGLVSLFVARARDVRSEHLQAESPELQIVFDPDRKR
jgi:hypothetical protein